MSPPSPIIRQFVSNLGSDNDNKECCTELSKESQKNLSRELRKDFPSVPIRAFDGFLKQEIESMRAAGIHISDDNEPSPENIYNDKIKADEKEPKVAYREWGFSGLCYRQQKAASNFDPKINIKLASREQQIHMDRGTWFLLMTPIGWLQETILVAINAKLPESLQISLWELVRWMGIWFLLATTSGHNIDAFWDDNTMDYCFSGVPFTLSSVMTKDRFEFINKKLFFTVIPKPNYDDKFHPILELQNAWNENMKKLFIPSWLVCIGISMSKWNSKSSCPGFLFCPQHSWSFGNKWHSIACVLCSIIFFVEIAEGKDRSPQASEKMFDTINGKEQKTIGMLLRMTQSIFNSFRIVLIENSFCVLQGIIELAKRGVYGTAIIKQQYYWPKYVNVDDIKDHFNNKDIGYVDALPGTLDNIPFHIFCSKEEKDVTMFMSSYGNMEGKAETRRVLKNGEIVNFKYIEVMDNYFTGRCAVDNNNIQRMQPISLEETRDTDCWEDHVFCFLMGVSASNAQFAYQYFGGKQKESALKFRRIMATDLIYNKWIPDSVREVDESRGSTRRKRKKPHNCQLITLPPYKKFSGSNIVACDGKYNKVLCHCKKRRVRTYCKCSPGTHWCNECYANHTQPE